MAYHVRATSGSALWLLGLIAAAFGPLHADIFGQAPSIVPAGHVHYTAAPAGVANRRARAATAEPGLPHVPRLHEECPGATVHQPGDESRVRVQPCGSPPRVSGGGAGSIRISPWRTGVRRSSSARTSTPLMEPNEEPAAYEQVQKAMSSSVARDAAGARATSRPWPSGIRARPRIAGRVTQAYADGDAERCTQRFPKDLDVAMLYVESIMDLRPWGYWQRDGAPHVGTAEIVRLTEQVMARNPRHPGALHMYIHLMESTTTPEEAEKAADTLLTLMPAAGHMVHMPGHIYQRVGRYADAIEQSAGHRGRRGLHLAVPCAGSVSHRLLSAQHSLPLVCRDVRRPERAGDRSRPQSRLEDRRRDAQGRAAHGRVSHGARTSRSPASDSGKRCCKEPEPPAFNAVLRAHVALRARTRLRRDGQTPAAERSWQN